MINVIKKQILIILVALLIVSGTVNSAIAHASEPPYYPEGTVIVYNARIMYLYNNGSVELELNTTLMIVLRNVTSTGYCMDSKVMKYEVIQASPKVQQLSKDDFDYLVNNLIDELEYYTEYCLDWNESFEEWLWFMVFDINAYDNPEGTSYIYEAGDYNVKPQYSYVDITTYGSDGILDVFVYISPSENIGFVIERLGGPIVPTTTTTTTISVTTSPATTNTSAILTGKWVVYNIEFDLHNETHDLVGTVRARYYVETGEGEVLDLNIKEIRGFDEDYVRESFSYITIPMTYDEPIRKYESPDTTVTLYYDEDTHVLYRFEATAPEGTLKGYLVDTNIEGLKDKIGAQIQTTTTTTQTSTTTSTLTTPVETTTTKPTSTSQTTTTEIQISSQATTRTTTTQKTSITSQTTGAGTISKPATSTRTETIAGGLLGENMMYYILIGVVIIVAIVAITIVLSRRRKRTYYPPPYQPPPPPPPP